VNNAGFCSKNWHIIFIVIITLIVFSFLISFGCEKEQVEEPCYVCVTGIRWKPNNPNPTNVTVSTTKYKKFCDNYDSLNLYKIQNTGTTQELHMINDNWTPMSTKEMYTACGLESGVEGLKEEVDAYFFDLP